jgi:hypothetical protein
MPDVLRRSSPPNYQLRPLPKHTKKSPKTSTYARIREVFV